MTKAYCDVVRLVGSTGEPPITVTPDPDMPDVLVLVSADGAKAVEYWGPFRLSLPADVARSLGHALIACANEVGAKK